MSFTDPIRKIQIFNVLLLLIIFSISSPFLDFRFSISTLLIGLCLTFFWKWQLPILRWVPFISSIFLLNAFAYVANRQPWSFALAPIGYLLSLWIASCFLRKKRRFAFSLLAVYGLVWMAVYQMAQGTLIGKFSYIMTAIWAFNFIILVRENDDSPGKKNISDFILSFSTPINASIGLYLNQREMLDLRCRSFVEYHENLRSAVLLLAQNLPLFLFRNATTLWVEGYALDKINFNLLLSQNNFPLFFDRVTSLIDGPKPLSAVIAVSVSGFFVLINLVLLYNYSVITARVLGFRFQAASNNVFYFSSLYDLVRRLYFYYNRIIVKVFHRRINSIPALRKLPDSLRVYVSLAIGGILIHLLQDIARFFYAHKLPGMFFLYLNLLPYFLILPAVIILSRSGNHQSTWERPYWIKLIRKILIFIVFAVVLTLSRFVKIDHLSWFEILDRLAIF